MASSGSPARKGGKKNRKHGRNKIKCAFYRSTRSVRNKERKLLRHLSRHPADTVAQTAYLIARVAI